ncbi:DUF5661 family protein [Clostridium sp. MB40-C1]|uniref:DUF5661 family protein n=1 Tax=Clostridium sp. MB40-C1 TaxID=3070996 RepID=UPI0027DEE1C6|nr:DUF5661 family protein [Clostridium sp. MB40-C1]WMJ82249.1 DUF5661 family protein [Clostridium sp. MB40-C1]
MYFSIPYYNPYNFYRSNPPYRTLEEALILVKESIQHEKDNELFYNFLISLAPTKEEKHIISTIRDDERKHNRWFKKIYTLYTGQSIYSSTNLNFQKPQSYIDAIKQAKLEKLNTIKRYSNIKTGISNRYYKDIASEILTDELKNAHKYDYILYLNLRKHRNSNPFSKTSFTLEEAAEIAHALGIDFTKEKFDLNQFVMGLNTELEHGRKYHPTNITDDDPLATGRIALAHLSEFPDYYTRLAKLEEEAKAYWNTARDYYRQTKEFTLSELAQYDGTMGKPAYVAVNGIVYDVSDISKWKGGTHYGLTAGKDLSSDFETCHGISSKLEKLPKVGILKG